MKKLNCLQCGLVEIDKSLIRAKGDPKSRTWEVDCPTCGNTISFLVGNDMNTIKRGSIVVHFTDKATKYRVIDIKGNTAICIKIEDVNELDVEFKLTELELIK